LSNGSLPKKHIYFENLDGLRFLSFLSVFFFHSFYTENPEIEQSSLYQFVNKFLFKNGNLGVNFFFVLSGFLITYLLIIEKKINGQVNLKNFWIRRILRIWPLFYLCVFFGFVIFPLLKTAVGQIPDETANVWAYLTFTSNFDIIKNGLPDSSILGVLWSIAIEEQFYLIWPIIIYVFPLNKLWIPFTVIIGSSLLFRAIYDNYYFREFHTLSCIGDMTIGATGAWLVYSSEKFKKFITNLKPWYILLIYVLFIIAYLYRRDLMRVAYEIRIFERSIIAMLIIMIILEQTFSVNSFFKIGSFKTISKLGVISYGLYCLHFIGLLITIKLVKLIGLHSNIYQVIFLEPAIALTITIIISKITYRYFESPFLKLKERFAFITKK
jgi:peptidoglycan/LPS O-acetylase OafA/YrhL